MTKAIAQTYSLVHEYRRRITLALLAGCAFLLLIYAVNVYSIISRTIALEAIQKQTATLTTAVDSLDSEYLKISGRIGPDSLKEYGFTQGQVSVFIPRNSSLGSLAARTHEL